jgi:hypothetical protein
MTNNTIGLTVVGLLIAWLIDRLLLQRGRITKVTAVYYCQHNFHHRFTLNYRLPPGVKTAVMSCQLTDQRDPSTIIQCADRPLTAPGIRHEFLDIPLTDYPITATPDDWWVLSIKTQTTARFNWLYDVFPITALHQCQLTHRSTDEGH